MVHRSMSASIGLAMFRVAAIAAQAPAMPPDSARLQGTWVMVSGAADGYPLPAEYVRQMKRVNIGREVTVTMGGTLFFKAIISLDTAQAPRAVDYHMTGGPTVGAVQLGIYSFSGDTVRFCFGAPGGIRPAGFTTVAGDKRTFSTWVRARP